NAQSTSLIQKQLKLDKVVSDCSPEDKARIVQETAYAMMVGDGINDVVALASSTIGMTMATGSDIAMEAGDVTIMGGQIQRVSDFFLIASKTMNKIKQNYFWAFIYNVIGIPLAAFGLLNPMFAAATMSLSSVSVILNSLLLSQAKIKKAD
ncbi:MAG: HAD-IC family P-type ATPase, partial [Streptococcaceae bacterium]|nr:HAD-IC family P-type ATPase [Streptococcaceae bacterium]